MDYLREEYDRLVAEAELEPDHPNSRFSEADLMQRSVPGVLESKAVYKLGLETGIGTLREREGWRTRPDS